MDVVWSTDGWCSVADVAARLHYARGESTLAYTTVKTVLSNLADKGHLAKKSAGRANVFKAKKSREDYQRSLIDAVVRPLMQTQRNPLLAHIAGELAADDDTYAEFEQLLKEQRARLRDG